MLASIIISILYTIPYLYFISLLIFFSFESGLCNLRTSLLERVREESLTAGASLKAKKRGPCNGVKVSAEVNE